MPQRLEGSLDLGLGRCLLHVCRHVGRQRRQSAMCRCQGMCTQAGQGPSMTPSEQPSSLDLQRCTAGQYSSARYNPGSLGQFTMRIC